MNRETAELRPGAEVDGFRVGARLHEGSMAVIYAIDTPPGALPLVMKVPRLAFGDHPACYVGFEVEQMVLGALGGPHVPKLVACGDLAREPYLVMERIEGADLSAYAARAPLTPEETAQVVVALAAAVHDLHRQNVIHLDLKPSNVLFRATGEAVLVDFGLAHHAHLPDLVDEEFRLPVGTGAYISPEQLAGNRSDPRSDLFALGVIAYQLATGMLPFGAPNGLAGMRRRLYVDPLPPRAVNEAVPDWLQEVILRCLEVRAEDRYATAAQLAHDLAHPGQVPLTARARRRHRAGPLAVLRRWLASRAAPGVAPPTPAAHLASAPHVLVAVDLDDSSENLAQAMRQALARTLAAEPRLRVTLVAVRGPELITEDAAREAEHSAHRQGLIELRHWARPLNLPADQARYHVLHDSDPAAALIDYATDHHVDRIILGARAHSALRRYLGSVSARVVAEAPCTVTVVRPARSAS